MNITKPTPISAIDLYNKLKGRINARLDEQPYQDDYGVWVDPLPSRDMAAMGTLIIKMMKEERELAATEDNQTRIMAIPVLPAIVDPD